mmetsp:Transcript_20625/g.19613  ORF Transcript_20625/g.19613 Transcript_20625/m.19613 type:complete len:104 (+) Transcript_20625:1163-1474(+)
MQRYYLHVDTFTFDFTICGIVLPEINDISYSILSTVLQVEIAQPIPESSSCEWEPYSFHMDGGPLNDQLFTFFVSDQGLTVFQVLVNDIDLAATYEITFSTVQ